AGFALVPAEAALTEAVLGEALVSSRFARTFAVCASTFVEPLFAVALAMRSSPCRTPIYRGLSRTLQALRRRRTVKSKMTKKRPLIYDKTARIRKLCYNPCIR